MTSKAKKLAKRTYVAVVFLDETTDGESIYVALNPELDGCISQGDTADEALENLALARIDYIESMLEAGMSIPDPMLLGNIISLNMRELYSEDVDIPAIEDSQNPLGEMAYN